MKKNLLIILLLSLFIIPIGVHAKGMCDGKTKNTEGYCKIKEKEVTDTYIYNSSKYSNSTSTWNHYIVPRRYYVDKTALFCIDADAAVPVKVNLARDLDMNKSLDRGLVAIYRVYLIDSTGKDEDAIDAYLTAANSAMRALVAITGNAILVNNSYYTDYLKNVATTLVGGTVDKGKVTIDMSSQSANEVQRMYCAGALAANISLTSAQKTVCNKALEASNGKKAINVDLLKLQNFDFTLFEDTSVARKVIDTSKEFSKEITLKLGGDGYSNMTKVFGTYGLLNSAIKITGCSVDKASKEAGFSCRLSGGGQNLLSTNSQKIILENNKLPEGDYNVKVYMAYSYKVPYDVSGLTILTCSGDSSYCNENGSKKPTQRMLLINSNRETNITLSFKAGKKPYECEDFTFDGSQYVAPDGTTTMTQVEYNNKCHTYGCDDYVCSGSKCVVPNTSSEMDYDDFVKECDMGPTVEGSKCQYTVDSNNNPKYIYNEKEVTEKEYLDKGCCDVNPNLLKNQDAIEHYKQYCQTQDVVQFEHKCGTAYTLGTQTGASIGDKYFSDITTTTCTNESYVDYTHSQIYQLPMNKVMDRVTALETSDAYKESVVGIYDGAGVNNYKDTNYLSKSINGTSVSAGNNYCMMFTSEENHLYFPGTAVATSGRFFVFNELTRESCLTSIDPDASCFRQPYIVGNIDTTMHTNFAKWEQDYLKAIETEKTAYSSGNTQAYRLAKSNRELLETYKKECESHNNIAGNWEYQLSPTLDFNYRQKVYGGTDRTEEIKETVGMEVSWEGVKYWPKSSTRATVVSGSTSGRVSNKPYTISYGNVNETKTFDQTTDYKARFTQTLYYKPNQVTYATIPSGEYVIKNEEYTTTEELYENGLMIGYVYNVRLTTYGGAYITSFTIDNVGHLASNSNVQRTLDNYKKDNKLEALESECVYCNQEGEFSRVCETCPDPDEQGLEPSYIYRTVSLADVTPNDRENTNWSDAKGKSAEERIQSLSGNSIVSKLNKDEEVKDFKAVTLDNLTTDAKTKSLAVGDIYDDSSREYLEYEFTLTTKDMQIIKKNTARRDFDYGSFNLCRNSNTKIEKSETADYCFTCNADGKECASSFIDAFADSQTTSVTRESKWKYYINNKWEFGKMSTISGFENGRYPDPTNQDAYLKIYSNWP